ncbi:FRG domain-containing protein [Rheinheimera sp. FR7-31]|uniref:FRG domain-containing protein n=1 Tax=Rheinheimera fenheensis TaxID=3152295 RepID=UPI00325EBE81
MDIKHSINSEKLYQSSWKSAYKRIRELQRWCQDEEELPNSSSSWLVKNATKGRKYFEDSLKKYFTICEFSQCETPKLMPDFIDELRLIANLKSSYDKRETGFVFEDVYHLAFDKLSSNWRPFGCEVASVSDCHRLYRGQRNDTWGVGASIYVNLSNSQVPNDKLRSDAIKACEAAQAIASKRNIPFAHGMAIAQHYKEITKVSTWFGDFSRDPWVALFFASYGGLSEERGVVWDISVDEWNRLSSGVGNPLGSFELIVPSGIQRIDNQAGVFLVAGIPRLFEQYVASGFGTRFKQHNGLHFEDESLNITSEIMFPDDDPLKKELSEALESIKKCTCDRSSLACYIPHQVFTDPLDPQTYEDILTSWVNTFQANGDKITEDFDLQSNLALLARFHALLQAPDYANNLPDIVCRSLNRLNDAYMRLLSNITESKPLFFRDTIYQAYVYQNLYQTDTVPIILTALDLIAPTDQDNNLIE